MLWEADYKLKVCCNSIVIKKTKPMNRWKNAEADHREASDKTVEYGKYHANIPSNNYICLHNLLIDVYPRKAIS